jgi:hypothetical protein
MGTAHLAPGFPAQGGLSGVVKPRRRLSRRSRKKGAGGCPSRFAPGPHLEAEEPALAASMELERFGSSPPCSYHPGGHVQHIGTVARSVVERRRDIAVLRGNGRKRLSLVARILYGKGFSRALPGAGRGVALGHHGCHILSSTGWCAFPMSILPPTCRHCLGSRHPDAELAAMALSVLRPSSLLAGLPPWTR